MIIIKPLIITICVMEVASLELDIEGIFNKNTDDIFNEKLGDIDKYKKDLDINRRKNIQQFMKDKQSFLINETFFDSLETTTTEKNLVTFTPLSKNEGPTQPPITVKELRSQLKKKEVIKLLRQARTQIPSFVNGDDEPNKLTQYFDLNISTQYSRRVFYDIENNEDGPRVYTEKLRLSFIMIQFIYMTRRQMDFMPLIREKYKKTVRYQIGYLFGLLRMVRQQQMVLHKTLLTWYEIYENAQIPLQFFYRIVMLNVDINDIMRYIIKLNYKQNLLVNSRYYFDSTEYYG